MAAIFFGFMWLQPKNENPDAQKNRDRRCSGGAISIFRSRLAFSVGTRMARQQHCRKRHREGALADSSRVTTIDENGLHLTLRGDSISGTVEVGGRQPSMPT